MSGLYSNTGSLFAGTLGQNIYMGDPDNSVASTPEWHLTFLQIEMRAAKGERRENRPTVAPMQYTAITT